MRLKCKHRALALTMFGLSTFGLTTGLGQVFGGSSLAAESPAFTPDTTSGLSTLSPSTEGFVANIRVQASFIVQASEIAVRNASSAGLKQWAKAERREQADVVNELSKAVPLDLLADMGKQDLATGRSVATGDFETNVLTPPSGVGVLMPAAAIGLAHLSSARRDAFDALYASMMRSVLGSLAGFYGAYARTGDNPTLRSIAARELLKTEADRAMLD